MTQAIRIQTINEGVAGIRDEYIIEAETTPKPIHITLIRIAPVAAIIAFLVASPVLWHTITLSPATPPIFTITAHASDGHYPSLDELREMWLSSALQSIGEIPYWVTCMPDGHYKTFAIVIQSHDLTEHDISNIYPVAEYNGKRITLGDEDTNIAFLAPFIETDILYSLNGWFTEPTKLDISLYQRGSGITGDCLLQQQSFLISFVDGEYIIEALMNSNSN